MHFPDHVMSSIEYKDDILVSFSVGLLFFLLFEYKNHNSINQAICHAYIICVVIAIVNTTFCLKKKITIDYTWLVHIYLSLKYAHARRAAIKKKIGDAENFKTKQSINAFMWVG
jgi:hypothetical protein